MKFDRGFFEKHQKILLLLANNRWLRWLLGLNRMPKGTTEGKKIIKIFPASVHVALKGRKEEAYCFTRPRFAEALAYNLKPVVVFVSRDRMRLVWRFSPIGALGLLAAFFVPKFGFLSFIGTVTDFFAGAGDGGVTLQGLANNLWATWRDGTTGSHVSYTNSTTSAGSSIAANPHIYVDGNTRYAGGRGFFPIDTSGLGASANISAASLFLCTNSKGRTTYANNNVEVTESTVVSDTVLATSDFDNVNNVKWATGILHDSLAAVGSFSEFVFNATGYGAINKTGYSKYAVRYAYDVDNSAPGLTGGSQIYYEIRTSEQAGTSSDPYLRVTYTTPVIISLNETVTHTDTLNRSLSRTFSETVTHTDTVSAVFLRFLDLIETVTFTDTIRNFISTIRFSEIATFIDTASIRNLWTKRTKPSSVWTERTPPVTNWDS